MSPPTSASAKLAAELRDAALPTPAPWKSIRDLLYLDAVIREAMRINPGIAMIFERVVPDGGFTLPDGRYLPADTKIGINPFVTNRDYGVFGDDADSFNPDRWLQGEAESVQQFEARSRRMKDTVDFVFGGGGRICMGRYLAMLEIKKLIATLYSLFEVSKLPNLSRLVRLHETDSSAHRFNWWTRSMSGNIEMPGLSTSMICP